MEKKITLNSSLNPFSPPSISKSKTHKGACVSHSEKQSESPLQKEKNKSEYSVELDSDSSSTHIETILKSPKSTKPFPKYLPSMDYAFVPKKSTSHLD